MTAQPTTTRSARIITKNKATNKTEVIKQYEIEVVDWGIQFYVETELDAYKAAYEYRKSPDTRIVYGDGRWMVTVFNKDPKEMGMD